MADDEETLHSHNTTKRKNPHITFAEHDEAFPLP